MVEEIVPACREHGYRLHEIALQLGVHYATVSRRFNGWSSENEMCDCRPRWRDSLALSPA